LELDGSDHLQIDDSTDWDFGTGDASNDKNPSYAFINSGSFNVKQNITANNGCNDSSMQSISITNSLALPVNFNLTQHSLHRSRFFTFIG